MTGASHPKKAATVTDIAKAAKVSKATAARALGGYGHVSEEVRSRVLHAADQLGYRPNAIARSMNTGRSNTIGVIVGDIENPFFARAVRGISDAANSAGYDVVLTNSDEDVAAEKAHLDLLLDKQMDALIVAPASSGASDHLDIVANAGRPLVLLDRRANGRSFDSVTVDNRSAAKKVTEHLIARGHTRIGFISKYPHSSETYRRGEEIGMSTVADRIGGITEALDEAGIEDAARYFRFDAHQTDLVELTRSLIEGDEPATAIITSDSLVAMSVINTLQRFDLAIPDDVSLVTFDNPDWTTITSPALTVIEQPIYELGVAAAELAIARIHSRSTGSHEAADESDASLDTGVENRVFDAVIHHRGSVAAVSRPSTTVTGHSKQRSAPKSRSDR